MGHRRRKPLEQGGVNLAIIITPFLDMAFQLLAFFIMTYHPSALEGHIDGNLLPPKAVKIAGSKPPPEKDEIPIDQLLEAKDSLSLNVKAVQGSEGSRTDGQPSRFEIRRPEDQNAPWKELGGPPLDLEKALEVLKTQLLALNKEGTFNKNQINLEADPNLRHEWVMRVYDVCKQGGYKDINFRAPLGAK